MLGCISLATLTAVHNNESFARQGAQAGSSAALLLGQPTQQSNVFTIVTTRREYQLAATSEADLKEWVEALRDTLRRGGVR